MDVVEFSKSDADEWDEFILNEQGGSLFESFRYRNVLERAYKLNAFYLGFRENRVLKGSLPLFMCPALVGGFNLVTLPYIGSYGALRSSSLSVDQELLNAAKQIAIATKAQSLEIRESSNRIADNLQFSSQTHFEYSLLKLRDSTDEIWKIDIDSKVRNQIRKAEKSNLVWNIHKENALPLFYEIYECTMRRLGSPAHSYDFFKDMFLEFRMESWIAIVTLDSIPVSAMWLIRTGNTVINPWAGSLREYAHLCGNNLNYWKSICWAQESGASAFHFGRSIKGSSQAKFKKQWGGESIDLAHYFFSPKNKAIHGIDPDSLSVRAFQTIWSHLPRFVNQNWGSRLARRIP